MGTSSVNVGTWSVKGIEHMNGREWGYDFHLGATVDRSPPYTTRVTRDAVMAAATQSEAAWLAALPTSVATWISGYPAPVRADWRDQDANP